MNKALNPEFDLGGYVSTLQKTCIFGPSTRIIPLAQIVYKYVSHNDMFHEFDAATNILRFRWYY